ncbi:hypothetical protein DF18_09150 [Streptomyces rimosus]|nr:hypothetical protein DF18_09150 [Streptomyces rimosus]
MISSVTARSAACSPSRPAKRLNSRGLPKRMVMRMARGRRRPVGWASNVPIIAQGITGTWAFIASAATPVRPL